MPTLTAKQSRRLKRWKAEPWTFWKDVEGTTFTPDIMAAMHALQVSDRVVVPSAHAQGKTHFAARYAIHFMQFNRPSRVITTAPTWSQVDELLWAEMRMAREQCRIELDGEMPPRACEWRISPNHKMIGLSPTEPNKMIGHHERHQLIVIDEAAGVDPPIWEGVRRIASGGRVKILAIGNPEAAEGSEEPFPAAAASDLWTTVYIDGYNHPNITRGRDPNGEYPVPGAITAEWIAEARDEWGEDSPMFQALVRGRFPAEGEDTLISLEWVRRSVALPKFTTDNRRVMAIDVARMGGDETVFTALDGANQISMEAFMGFPVDRVVDEAERYFHALGWDKQKDLIVVDDVGLGGGVTDYLTRHGYKVYPFQGGAKPYDEGMFRNRREESWWWLREALRKEELKLLDDDKQKAQLTSIKKIPKYDGTFQIERKEDMRKRGISSPDRGDALVMAWYGRRARVRLEFGASDRRSPSLFNRAKDSTGNSRHRFGFLS